MTALKRALKRPTAQRLIAYVAAFYVALLHKTTRWRQEKPPETAALLGRGEPFIACFWHGRVMLLRTAWEKDPKRFHPLISGHRDGIMIAKGLSLLGFPSVTGSSRKGGTQALIALTRILRRGDSVGITPDGPTGPRMRAKPGAIKLAQMTGAPIVPLSGAVRRRWLLSRWDRLSIGHLFSEGIICWGEPIHVPRLASEADCEALRAQLEENLNALTARAERRFDHTPVEPAPLEKV